MQVIKFQILVSFQKILQSIIMVVNNMEKPRYKCLNPLPLQVDFLYDINIENPYSKKNIESGKEFTSLDIRKNELNRKQGSILAPCGKCFLCRKNRINEWFVRYLVEKQTNYLNSFTLFITLTYADITDPSLNYRDIQLFLKRLRKYYSDFKLKFLCVGEYGFKSDRKHWHLMILGFNHLPDNYKQVIQHLWNKGFTVTKICDENTVYYLLKYSFKSFHKDSDYYKDKGLTPPIFRASQSFGKDFALIYKDRILSDKFLSYNNFKYRIPRYFIKLYRKLGLLDGWTILDNYKKSISEYMVNVLRYFGIELGLSDDTSFHTLRDMKLFLSKVGNLFVDINNNLYYNFFDNFTEAI